MSDVPTAIEFDATSHVLTVTGELSEEHVVAVQSAIQRHSGQVAGPLVLDLTGVTFLPSVAVGMLVRVSRELADTETPLEVVAASGSIAQRVLSVCAMPHRSI